MKNTDVYRAPVSAHFEPIATKTDGTVFFMAQMDTDPEHVAKKDFFKAKKWNILQ